MNFRAVFRTLALFAIVACQDAPTSSRSAPVPSARASSAGTSLQAQGSYIVLLSRTASEVDARAAELALLHGGDVTTVYHRAVIGFAGHFSADQVALLRQHGDVSHIESDAQMSIGTTQLGATWGLDRIDQRALPVNGSYSYNFTGAGVHVYIIDTGIRTTHSEFGGRASGAFNAVADTNGTNDCNGHGTHVSGTVGGATYGVAKAVTLHAVRVLGCTGSGSTSGVIAGIDWVTKNHISPAVANMSLGGGFSFALDSAVQSSIASGVTYAIAAGNSNANACLASPAATPEAITVAATDQSDNRASFSNFGSCVDIFAPGVSITSAWNGSDTQTNTISGTSMAAPHVAGAAALYLQANPTATPAAVRNALVSNATAGAIAGGGTGSPDALLYTGFIGGPVNQPPVARFTVVCGTSNFLCTLDATTSTDDVGIVTYAWDLGKTPGQFVTGPVQSNVDYYQVAPRTVKLTVTDGGGLTSSVTQTFNVPATGGNQAPVAAFTASCTNLACTFDSSGSTDDVGIVSRSWTFGDGTTAGNVVAPPHTYGAGGTYTVSLTVTDGGGLTNSKTTTVTVAPVNQPPVPAFTVTCGASFICTLDGTPSTDDVGVVSYSWDIGKSPGQFPTGPVQSNLDYYHTGLRTVKLTVTDGGGLSNLITQTFNVTGTAFKLLCTNSGCTPTP